ncbi:MAG TPA: hypothetical protein VNL15_03440 [Dehalococcoidia bacterium]|nr:hypothetical protein [Dehalococcoidia bacterium]
MTSAPRTQREAAVRQALRTSSLPLLLTVVLLAVGFAALLPLIQSSVATTRNGQIQQLERAKADWQAQVQESEALIAYLGSLDRIEREAVQRGMKPPEQTYYVKIPGPGPESKKLPSRFLPPPERPLQPEESWWEKIFGWVPLP